MHIYKIPIYIYMNWYIYIIYYQLTDLHELLYICIYVFDIFLNELIYVLYLSIYVYMHVSSFYYVNNGC